MPTLAHLGITAADALRYYVVVANILIVALLGRLTFLRYRRGEPRMWTGSANNWTVMGLCWMLVTGVLRRFDTIGDPADWFLWSATIATTLLGIGLLRTASWRGSGSARGKGPL